MPPKTIIHLLSGGLDSVTLMHHLLDEGHSVHCVLFNYHQAHAQELLWAKSACHKRNVMFTTVDLPELGGLTDASWIVPFRNPIMLTLAVNLAVKAGADTVTIGCNADDADEFPDCRWAVIDALNHAIKLSGYSIEICAPFIQRRKAYIGALAQQMGLKTSDFWSCYRGGANPCGECPACKKLNAAMTT